jgi:hypothetical protein
LTSYRVLRRHDTGTEGTSEMDDESTLRKKAREAMQAGRLPSRLPKHMWGGPGVGACCAICGSPTQPDEFELEFTREGNGRQPDNEHVHVRCFGAWEFEHTHNLPVPGDDRMITAHGGDATDR